MDFIIAWIANFIWTAIPLWVWFFVGCILLGMAWRAFGWQGVIGGLLALLTLGAYRQGYRDSNDRKPPMVPIEDYEKLIAGERDPGYRPNKPRRNVWSVVDILRGRND